MSWAALGAAALTALSAGAKIWQQADTNKQNLNIAREQMAFQERMSDTSHQREAEDLRKAGLNPILTANGGAGATTPSGASANMVNPMSGFDPLAIIAVEKGNADISKTKAETLATLATERNLDEQNQNLRVQNTVLRAQAQKYLVDMGMTKIQAAKILSDMSGTVTQTYNHGTGSLAGVFYNIDSKKTATRPVDYPENAMSRLPDDYWTNPNASLSRPGQARKSFRDK